MRQIPVCISVQGVHELFVFPEFQDAGQCTGQTKQRQRCRNPVWDQGQVANYARTFVEDRAVRYYGPLPEDAGRRYLEQRCRVHDTPDAPAYCDPEWERFDPIRHADMTTEPRLTDFVDDLIHGKVPSIDVFAIALRRQFTEAECRQLADKLTS